MSAEVVPLRLTTQAALRLIREIAGDTSRVGFTAHAKKRMRQRKINRTQVYRCLRRGTVVEGPYEDVKGFWRCTLETITAGDEIHVAVAFNTKERVIVITTF